MEVVVSCTLLAILLPLLFNLFPSSLRALKRSGVQQAEATLAAYRMDEAALLVRSAVPSISLPDVVLDGRLYHLSRTCTAVDAYRLDVAVTVKTDNYQPFTVQSRFLVGNSP
ncbi:unnamed protein product [Phaeothamnion confervicola]